jgi:hypothetical protein
MNKSESIGALATALAKVQGVIEGASKDASNPFFKSKYSTLAAVWEVIRKPLSENGLAIVQTGVPNEDQSIVSIETTLIHSSGEWISGIMSAKLAKQDSQSVGSAVSYLRRYSLSSVCGVYSEDDDAEAATPKETPTKPTSQEKKALPKEDVPEHIEVEKSPEEIAFSRMTPELQIQTLTEMHTKNPIPITRKIADYSATERNKFYKLLKSKEATK